MKGNKKLLVIAALILLITITYTTYAIYKTSATGTGNVTAAIWDVTFEEGETELEDEYVITFSGSDCNNAHVAPGKIAPGATCTKTIVLNAGNTEVDVTYSASVGEITATSSGSSGTAISTANANEFSATLSNSSGSIAYNAETRTVNLTLTVEWGGIDDSTSSPADVKNNADTALNGATISVPITLTAKQLVGNS